MSRLRRDTLELWKASVPSKLIRRMRATKGENFPSCLANLLLFLRIRQRKRSWSQCSTGLGSTQLGVRK